MVNYQDRYTTLSEEELLTLAAQEATMVDAARTALHVELGRRGLQNTSLDRYQEQVQKEIDSANRLCKPVVEGKWVKVVVPNGPLLFPSVCPSCLGPNPETPVSINSERGTFKHRIVYTKVKYLVLEFPHCKACARRFKFWQGISTVSIFLGMGVTAVISEKFKMDRWAVWLLIVPFCGPGIWASIYLKRSVRLVDYDDKGLEFKFHSIEYANVFYGLNSRD